jgi:hypothetical protein
MATTQTETKYQLADPADVKKILESYPTSVLSSEALPGAIPHPGLNGKRIVLRWQEIKTPEDHAIYFVWGEGLKCVIPDSDTFHDLFPGVEGVIELSRAELNRIASGPALSTGAAIVRGKGQAPNYLVSNSHKHYITSPTVMAYCHFRGPKEIPRAVIEAIPAAFDIDYGAGA